MTDRESFSDEGLDQVLQPLPPHAMNAELRQSLLRQTTRVLRRRRWLRQCSFAVLLAMCYLAGIVTMHFRPHPASDSAVAEKAAPEEVPGKPLVPPVVPPPVVAQAPPIDPHLSAAALEKLGEQASGEKRIAQFILAGQRYEKAGELAAALRCYKLALDGGTESDLVFAESDSYLLMALKTARQKEKHHGKHGT